MTNMANVYFMSIITWLLLWTANGTSDELQLQRDGLNVCPRERSLQVIAIYGNSWPEAWPCEEYYSSSICSRIRSGEINIETIFVPHIDFTCCPGWQLEDSGQCETPCSVGLYGRNCSFECHCVHGSNCNHVTGSCDCDEGWTGRDCDQRCAPGNYGPNCNEKTFPCQNGGTNHPVSGDCLCPVSHQGEYCEEVCLQPCPVNCLKCVTGNTAVCDNTIQVCRCKSGWQGRYCTEPCDPGFTGPFCDDPCCSGNGIYERKGRGCKCNDGYHGDECEHKCDTDRFGSYCGDVCDCEACDHITGVCTYCPPGYYGDSCTDICPENTWGNCNSTCRCDAGVTCSFISGECFEEELSDPIPHKLITGSVTAAGGVLLILLLAVIIFISLKCMAKETKSPKNTEEFPSLNIQQQERDEHNRKNEDIPLRFDKEDPNIVYQEIDDYPYRYTKPGQPGSPSDIIQHPDYERMLNQSDPHYLIPDKL